MSEPSMT